MRGLDCCCCEKSRTVVLVPDLIFVFVVDLMSEQSQATLVVVDGGLLIGKHQQQVLLLSFQGLELAPEVDVDVVVGGRRDLQPLDLRVLSGKRGPERGKPDAVRSEKNSFVWSAPTLKGKLCLIARLRCESLLVKQVDGYSNGSAGSGFQG